MNKDIAKNDEKLRVVIMERVLLGITVIGLVQSLMTILGHKSTSSSLYIILSLVPLSALTYLLVCTQNKKS